MSNVSADLKTRFAQRPGLTLAAAESLTAGRVQAVIASASGASAYFVGGLTAYTLEEKVKLLGVSRAVAEPVDCVSAEVAEQMARGVCRLFGSKVGVATTGYAEPAPAHGVRVPMAWWALVWRGDKPDHWRVRHGRVECPGAKRVEVQLIVADAVLAELVAWIDEMAD